MRMFLIALILAAPFVSTSYAQGPMMASGEVVSVRLLTRTMRVRDASANEVIRYAVPNEVPVTLAGQRGRLGYLRSGDRVEVEYVNTNEGRQAAAIRVPQPTPQMDQRATDGDMSTITGRVERADFGNRTLTILGDQSGERFTYAIPQTTRVTIAGQDARFGQLRRGDQVTLRFREDSGQRTAARVRVPQPTTPLAQRENQAPPAGVTAQQTAQQPRTQLPRTASPMPLLGLVGLFALTGAAILRVRRRISAGIAK